MKVIICHPTANSNVRAIVTKLAQQEKLYQFHTSIAVFPKSNLELLSRLSLFNPLKRRTFNPILEKYTITHPFNDIARTVFSKLAITYLTKPEVGCFSVEKIYQNLDYNVSTTLKKAKENGVTAVYAYEDGALEIFLQAKKLGLICIYDLPIAYWETGRKLMLEEEQRIPKWAPTLGGGISDSKAKLERKRKELELADVVIGPSSFVIDSLPTWSKDKIKIISPFGSPQNYSDRILSENKRDKPLRVLFVGSMGQRKGLGDLFEAIKQFENTSIELVVLGSLLAPIEFYQSQLSNFKYEAGRSHDEVLKLMRTCDVFCLPSIVEGRALVIQEAMSQGLPIIITPNTGGEDLVIEGETGFLVPIRSPNAIASKLKWFLENRNSLHVMGKKASKHSKNYTWDSYSETIIESLKVILDNHKN
ncbi:glycosyltransferase involved in cell wall biosynthesis [Flavobacterium sp. PL11]|uniref:glycosyltransferase family 4 protein n=1 Tax=Flavobacterium sp. PL11 TaxID=3071717 RepID=UPI002E05923F|nr:glycosyltransferase involved in cell wall biosynthesis [Flavobacterium sp. PL11]